VRAIAGRLRPVGWVIGIVILPAATWAGLVIADVPAPSRVAWSVVPIGLGLVVASAFTVRKWSRSAPRWLLAALVLLSAGGVWAGPPENDHTVAVIGAAAGCVVVFVLWSGRAGMVVAAVDCLVVVWAALGGGAGKVDPTIAGVLCLGLLPFGVLIPRAAWKLLLADRWCVAALLVGHAVVVFVASRVYAAHYDDVFGLECAVVAGAVVAAALPATLRWVRT
jgi:hypothetical protein